MTSNISKPKWLTDEVIEELRHDIEICANPYTEKEILKLKLDGSIDMKRSNAYMAIKTLNKYGIPLSSTTKDSRRNHKVYIISGAPASGKTTYVMQHKNDGDLIFDLDMICAALGGTNDLYDDHKPYLDVAIAIRNTVYQKIEAREGNWNDAYIITSSKDKKMIDELVKTLKAELVCINKTKEECLENAKNDARRQANLDKHIEIIKKYFDE